MDRIQELEKNFQEWKKEKDTKLLSLYQKRFELEKSGKDFKSVDEKIKKIEHEINQKKEKLDRDLFQIYKKSQPTDTIYKLGKLIEKAGLAELSPTIIFGMLIEQKEKIENDKNILKQWEERGLKALEE